MGSEQQLVDCSKANNGCGGGNMETGFQFEEGVNVATESSYPYTARDGSCKSSGYSTAVPRGGVTGYKSVSSSSSGLQSALNTGPVSVAIEADQNSFQGYTGGGITSGCGTNLDHGVTPLATPLATSLSRIHGDRLGATMATCTSAAVATCAASTLMHPTPQSQDLCRCRL